MLRDLLWRSCLTCIALLSIQQSDAQSLVQLGYFPFNGLFAVSGYDQYMLTGAGHLVDVSVPSSPVLAGNASIGLGTSVIVDGQYAFFGTGMTPIVRVVDLTVPSAPISIGSVSLPASAGVFGLARSGNVLFAANAQQGLASIDISDPLSPVLVQQLSIPSGEQARGVVVNGTYCYVADGSGLKIIDVTDPSNMEILGSLGSGYVSVAISEDASRLAVGQSGGGALVFDLVDPSFPQVLYGVPEAEGTAHSVQISDGHLLVSSEQYGVRMYQMGSSSASLIGSFNNQSNGQTFGAFASGDLVFVTGLVNGAAVLGYDSVGIEENDNGYDGLHCYPVPVVDELRYSLPPDLAVKEVRVSDAQGRVVRVDPASDGRINTSELAPGTYTVTIICTDRSVRMKRFVR